MFNKLTVFALAAMASSFVSAASAQDCNLKQYASLPLTYLKNGEIGVPVKIAGKDRLFMLALEAASSAVTPKILDELNLDVVTVIPGQENALRVTIAGQKVVRTTHLPEMKIGEASGKNLAIAALDHPMDLPEEDGVLATDILGKFDFEIDFAKNVLNLYSQDHCPGKVVYWSGTYTDVPFETDDAGRMYFAVKLDDKPLKAWISLFDGPDLIAFRKVNSLFGLDAKDMTLLRENDSSKEYRYPFKLFAMGDIAVKNPDIVIQDAGRMPPPSAGGGGWGTTVDWLKLVGPEMDLRRNFLKHLHLYFAFGEKKLYITGADAHR